MKQTSYKDVWTLYCLKSDSGREYTVKVSYIEIYKEELRDLIDFDTTKDLHIREDDKGNTSECKIYSNGYIWW